MMQCADKVALFLKNSMKRQLELEHWIDSTLEGKCKKLKEMCRTRWVEHHDDFQTFSDLFYLQLVVPRLLLTAQLLSGTEIQDQMPGHSY